MSQNFFFSYISQEHQKQAINKYNANLESGHKGYEDQQKI